MTKLKTVYICSSCSYQSPRWSGQCFDCNKWNTFVEDVVDDEVLKETTFRASSLDPTCLWSDKIEWEWDRLTTWISEFDRVLGWGFVKDSLVLLTWNPWIWKSTLILQACWAVARDKKKVLYISWEESVSQISLRATRLFWKDLPWIDVLNNTDVDSIISTIEKHNPDFVVIDSINVMSIKWVNWISWSISQIKACTEVLMQFFKKKSIPLLLIGQVTKDWEMAWPQLLAHLVDVVLSFEWERHSNFRMLRGNKNRFWPTSEVWIFEMDNNGLNEVTNPSEVFLEWRWKNADGSCISVTVEWTRPLLVEIQALTTYTNFTYPKRVTSWVDLSRLNILIAVLQKHCWIKLDQMDVFVNAVGWFRLNEPALDLAILSAIISSKNKKVIPEKSIYFGEVWLSWEVRSVPFLEKRLKEIEKLWFEKVYIPKIKKLPKTKLEVVQVENVKEIL